MNSIPYEIKLTYIIAIIIMLLFVGFILFVVMTYNRKQLLYIKEKQLREAEYQNSLLQEELKRQQAIYEERERISHDMHDELGAGISAIKLQAEFLQQKIADTQSLHDIQELLKTAESMNLSMREMLWSLNSENDNLTGFVQYLCNYAKKFFHKTEIKVNCNYSNFDLNKSIHSEVRRNLLLCFKEALNNIYKHAESSQVLLRFYEKENTFYIDIQDNGKGFDHNISLGNGLRNMKTRMENVSGEFSFRTTPKGALLIFSLVLF